MRRRQCIQTAAASIAAAQTARPNVMTGRHPIRYGPAYSVVRPWSHYGLSTAEKTIADVFKEAELLPRSRGFDHFYGHVNGAMDYFAHNRGDAIDWQRNGETEGGGTVTRHD